MSSLAERTQGPFARGNGLSDRLSERPRDMQEVALLMIDGTSIRGMLHRTPGTRTLDYLNRQAESFVAVTDAVVVHLEVTEHVTFMALNKTHIVQLVEVEVAA